jgi:uncharacterized membrane protein (DUF4010 family)
VNDETLTHFLAAFLTSIAIGLLIGVERERNPSAKAGLRTFPLITLFGTLAAALAEMGDSTWIVAAGLLLVGLSIISAYHNAPPETDPGTTTVVAVLIAYGLGVMCWYGEGTLAVMLAVGVTALLYFKPELRGTLERLERRDLLAVLQFAALTFVVLPVLPDHGYGPYGVLNPYQIWLMVVLVSGLSLAGYIALKLVRMRRGLALVGVLGGLVSSTATTLVYARRAREASFTAAAAGVLLVANLAVFVRVAVVSAIVQPRATIALLYVLVPAVVAGGLTVAVFLRHLIAHGEAPLPEIKNPTELRAALGFGALFAVVLFLAAWLSDAAGSRGLYALAAVSGLTDVDAITLSSLRLFSLDRLSGPQLASAIAIAIASNMGFKFALALAVGGPALARRLALPGVVALAAGAAGLAALWAS